MKNSLEHTEDDVWDKEDGGSDIVLVPNQSEIFIHPLNLCVSNVAAIDMCQ